MTPRPIKPARPTYSEASASMGWLLAVVIAAVVYVVAMWALVVWAVA